MCARIVTSCMCRGSPMTDYHMATHLVRWWKTKILSGYKQFTAVLPADCGEGDGRPSDTEELLRPDCEPPPTTPPLVKASLHQPPPPHPHQTPPQPQPPKRELNFEGFECDVSVEGGADPSDRQEFSFTLYDFDGHGKITKDDIAGLVTTIYDTLGSSIKVPHYGSKTIKVKLTVSPDPPAPAQSSPGGAPPPQPRRYKRDLNVTIRERRRRPTRRHSISSSAASEDREADVSEEEDEPSQPPPPLSRLGGHNLNTNSCRLSSNLQSRCKKRSSSLQRQELLQIIQANMEKNNLCFKTSRKHYSSPGHDTSRHKSPQHCWDKCGSPRGGRGRGKVPKPEVPPTTTTTSPHHLKHRHREQEQARAMAQVVRWLEQEFSPPQDKSRKSGTGQRTEHHHVHEHVHHHYHHYQDTPLLV